MKTWVQVVIVGLLLIILALLLFQPRPGRYEYTGSNVVIDTATGKLLRRQIESPKRKSPKGEEISFEELRERFRPKPKKKAGEE